MLSNEKVPEPRRSNPTPAYPRRTRGTPRREFVAICSRAKWPNLLLSIVGKTGGGIQQQEDPHVRSQSRRHDDVNRGYHARRIHRAAQRPNKPASWDVGI